MQDILLTYHQCTSFDLHGHVKIWKLWGRSPQTLPFIWTNAMSSITEQLRVSYPDIWIA